MLEAACPSWSLLVGEGVFAGQGFIESELWRWFQSCRMCCAWMQSHDRIHVCVGIAHGLQSYPEQYFSQAGLRPPLFGYSLALMHLGVMTKWLSLGISNSHKCGLSSSDVWNCH